MEPNNDPDGGRMRRFTVPPLLPIFLILLTFLYRDVAAETVELTAEEKSWLQEHQTIRVSGPQAFPPFQYVDEKGRFVGMATEYLSLISEMVGLEIVVVKDLSWPEILKKVQEKEIDVLSCAAVTPERTKYLDFTNKHLTFPLIIVNRKDAPPTHDIYDLRNRQVAYVRKNATYEWMQEKDIIGSPQFVDTPLEAMRNVSLGRADAHIENLAAASYMIEKYGFTNLKIAAPTPFDDYSLAVGVRKDWPELVSIFNKCLAAISQQQHNAIHRNWISVRYEYGIHSRDVLKWISWTVLTAGGLVLLFVFWNRRLAKEVEERRKAEAEKEDLIAELTTALEEIKTLRGILPICSQCKKIRDDTGYWTQIETYIGTHSEADFSHSICPDCLQQLYGKEDWFDKTG